MSYTRVALPAQAAPFAAPRSGRALSLKTKSALLTRHVRRTKTLSHMRFLSGEMVSGAAVPSIPEVQGKFCH
ncbi:hypothetical protein GCM10008171_26060 [Methylopila jiangsuensis]|uniref:Uncharacterized protein n=1 Tax=Methylopila jiangsuensis TaxID=586230 RepID=A0A9W6N4M6_9HYPH|nr:hypothetical protein GCM10008171_26060 [Methylopila jiangsuensis]